MPGNKPLAAAQPDRSDWRLFDAAIRLNLAYADVLIEPGILTAAERDSIAVALEQLKAEQLAGMLTGDDMAATLEKRLYEIAGKAAGKLQVGRSPNEQLLTLVRLWLVDQIETLGDLIADVQRTLLHQAESHVAALMPGYAQMQPSQIISFSHWLLSTFWMLARDQERLVNSLGRTSISPLGSGLLAGTPYRVDREALAQAIGLTDVTQNSLDAASDWDFAAEFLFAASLLATHLSSLAEDLLLYNNPSFGFVSLEVDAMETLSRVCAMADRLFGQVTGVSGALKTLHSRTVNPVAAALHLSLYEGVDTLLSVLPDLAVMLESLTVNADRMWDALDESILASDLSDYLSERGIARPDAQAIVKRVVARADAANVPLSEVEIADFQAESHAFESDVYTIFDFSRSVGRRTATGGTAPSAVRAQIRQASTWLVEAGFE